MLGPGVSRITIITWRSLLNILLLVMFYRFDWQVCLLNNNMHNTCNTLTVVLSSRVMLMCLLSALALSVKEKHEKLRLPALSILSILIWEDAEIVQCMSECDHRFYHTKCETVK